MEELKALNLLALAMALGLALVGMFAHYIKKWLRGEIHDSLITYLFGKDSWKNTVQAVFAVVATVFGMFTAGQLDLSSMSGLVTIFTIGYVGNSALNKDSVQALASKLKPSTV